MTENLDFGSHFDSTVQTGSSYNQQRDICSRLHQPWQNKTLITSLSSGFTELSAYIHVFVCFTFLRMGKTASTTFLFTYFIDLH